MLATSRRSFLAGAAAFVAAAPAIVRASSLMPVKSVTVTEFPAVRCGYTSLYSVEQREIVMNHIAMVYQVPRRYLDGVVAINEEASRKFFMETGNGGPGLFGELV